MILNCKQEKKVDLNDLRDKISKGISVEELIQEDPLLYRQYKKTLDKLENIYLQTKFRNWETKAIWYWGTIKTYHFVSTDKSHNSYKDFKHINKSTHYNLNYNSDGFWNGYWGQKIVIINKTRGEIPFGELLKICDKYPYNVEIKGGCIVPLLCDTVLISSYKHPKDIYINLLDKDDMEQFSRRFEVIECK